jgi:signal transduction histidine kinase
MHKRLIEEGFNRRYVLGPLLLAISLVVTGFVITEVRRYETRQLADTLRERQDVMRVLAEIIYKALEAESAQRGFLLTGEAKYLTPLDAGIEDARAGLDEAIRRFRTLAPGEVALLQKVRADLDSKSEEMHRSVTLLKQNQPFMAMALVKSDVGLYLMSSMENALESVRTRERARIFAELNVWTESIRLNTIINLCGALFTICVLITLGLLASRDLRRRQVYAGQLASEIEARTRDVRDLSQHMSRVSESEKHALSRELHDELGGLLVAMRMDIAQLRKRAGPSAEQDPDLKARWTRVEQALADGVELKSRVIEALRPTLLDNMGLFSALRWMASQSAEQANLYLKMEGMEKDIELPVETAIAVFRTAQEAIANIVRHASARRISMKAETGDRLTIQIADDGRGLPAGSEQRTGSHGLKQMRFRMEAVGGTLNLASNELGGTTVQLSVPLAQ